MFWSWFFNTYYGFICMLLLLCSWIIFYMSGCKSLPGGFPIFAYIKHKFTIYCVTWFGSSANNYCESRSGFIPTYLNGTNCTISRCAFFPWPLYNPLSPSNLTMLVNYAFPTPTIMIDKGKLQLFTIRSTVCYISWIYPSVKISKIWYTFDPSL